MKRAVFAALGLGVLAGCPAPREYDNPPDVPPPPAVASSAAPVVRAGPQAGEYFKTESSDAWVAHNFKLQPAYARVLLVGEPKVGSIDVAPPSLGPASLGKQAHPVDAYFATIQEAIDASGPGDLIAVQPGRYAGFVVGPIEGAGDGAYTFVRALGAPGVVVIDRQSLDASWMIYGRTAHHVVIEGFHVKGTGDGKGPRAGIMLDGDFGRSGKLLRNVAVVGVLSFGHKTWGLHSTDTATVLIQDSAFGGSVLEHGLYASDGSDDWVIRRNVFFDNYAGGLQINLDPLASLEETVRHIGMMGAPPVAESRAWAQEIVARATRAYGANNFPDGRGINFIVEDNVATNNGKKGGAAFNFAVICESLIQNNLAYGNFAGGLVLWDNKNPYDRELTDNPPTKAADWVEEKKPLFGSRDNLVRNNTFFNQASPRAAIQVRHGSFGNRFFSNVALHGTGPGMWVTPDSLERLEARGNVMGSIQTDGASSELLALATLMPAAGSTVNVAFDDVWRAMVAPSAERWIDLDGGWWRPSPKRPDFRPKEPGGFFKPAGPAPLLALDLRGKKRAADVPGALAP